MSNTPKVELTYELYVHTIQLVLSVWKSTKLFSTKGDKQLMLIINSKHTYASIINTKYALVEGQPSMSLEQAFGSKQFAQDITSAVMQELLLGSH